MTHPPASNHPQPRRPHERFGSRHPVSTLVLVAFTVLVGITLYEIFKQLIAPEITIWQSHIVTIIVVTVTSVIAAYFILRRRRELVDRLSMREDLLRQQEKLRIVADFTYDWEYWLDPEGHLLYLSPSCRRITGYEAEDFLRDERLIAEMIHPEDRAEFEEHLLQERTSDAPMELEFRIVCRNGDICWIGHACQQVVDGSGRFLGRRISNRDVTERRLATEALRQSKELYRAIIRNIPAGAVFVVDSGLTVSFAEGQLLRLVEKGVSEKDREGSLATIEDLLGMSVAEQCRDALNGKTTDAESENLGRQIWSTYVPLRDTEGKVLSALVMAIDVTERRKTEELLRQTRILDQVEDAIIAVDSEEVVRYLNQAAYRQYEIDSREQVVGSRLDDHLPIRWPDAEQEETIRRSLHETGSWKGISTHVTRGGRVLWVESFITEVRGRGGTPIGRVAVIRDTTERKRLEEDCLKAARELAEANRELESFSYSVSHDLRAPLRTIIGFSSALLEDYTETIDSVGQNYLRRIAGGAQKMDVLIQDMLSLSRISRQELEPENVDLSAIAGSIVEELRRDEPQRRVDIVIQPQMPARGDPRMLHLAMSNLVRNAWKYTSKNPEARIEIGSRRQGEEEVFFVRDNGAGFESQYAEDLFSPFKRLHTDSEFPGTGIGLAIVERVIRKHGGRVWAEGQVGKGARFFFTLH